MVNDDGRKNSPTWRKDREEHCGTRCVNCGSDQNIEYHHIVPLFMGGTDKLSNIVCLCHDCHEKAHAKLPHAQKGQPNIGRSCNAKKLGDKRFKIYDKYIRGEIGNSRAQELLGYASRTRLGDRADFKKYIDGKGIAKVHNHLDVVKEKNLYEGREVAEIIMKNGDRVPVHFHKTADYSEKRRQKC